MSWSAALDSSTKATCNEGTPKRTPALANWCWLSDNLQPRGPLLVPRGVSVHSGSAGPFRAFYLAGAQEPPASRASAALLYKSAPAPLTAASHACTPATRSFCTSSPAPKKAVPKDNSPPRLSQDRAWRLDVFQRAAPGVVRIEVRMSPAGELALEAAASAAATAATAAAGLSEPGTLVRSKMTAVGSACVWDLEGRVVTNYHVIERAIKYGELVELRLILQDGSRCQARVVGVDPLNDLALLQLPDDKRESLVPLETSSSTSLCIGQRVLHIGHPDGVADVMSQGMITSLGCTNIDIYGHTLTDMINSDASTWGGNSGGAMLDSAGRLVGIITRGNLDGQGFAIPVHKVHESVTKMKLQGTSPRAWWQLGASLSQGSAVPWAALDGVASWSGEEQRNVAVYQAVAPLLARLYVFRLAEQSGAMSEGAAGLVKDARSLQTAWVWDNCGRMSASYHAVQGATSLVVVLPDNSLWPATVACTDKENDTVLLQLATCPPQWTALPLYGCSLKPVPARLNQQVLAVEDPIGMWGSMTQGTVGHIKRDQQVGATLLKGLVQTNATRHPYTFGGVLLMAGGKSAGVTDCIGVTTWGAGNIIHNAVPFSRVHRSMVRMVELQELTQRQALTAVGGQAPKQANSSATATVSAEVPTPGARPGRSPAEAPSRLPRQKPGQRNFHSSAC